MRLHSQNSVRWPSAGLVTETLRSTRERFGPDWISWSVDPTTSTVTVVAQDDEPFPTPIRLTSGRVARAASTYVADLDGLSIARIAGTLNGPGDGATPERADVAVDYLSPGRGRATASVSLVPPYGLTTRSDVPELQWDATAVDGSHATAHADVRLRWAAGTVDVTIDADRSLLDISVGFGPTGFWKPLLTPVLWLTQAKITAGFDAWCASVAESINQGLPEELARIRNAKDTEDPSVEPADVPAPISINLDPWVDVRWLHSPVSILRHVYRQAKAPAVNS